MSDLLSPFGKLALLKDFFAPVCSKAEITLGDFVRHRFGGEILERILTPAVTGIYAADPDAMSLQATFPFLSEWEINSGSVIRGALAARKRKKKNQPGGKKESYALLSFQGGLGELPQAIHRALGPGVVRCGMPVQQLKKLENGLFQVKTATGVFESETLVMATPADVTKMLLLPTQPSISRRLSEITYAPMNLVYLAFEKSKLRKPWKGFGFLVPRNQKVKLLGAIWNNSLFPERYPEALSVGTYFQGGAFHLELSDIPDEALIDITVAELRKIHQEKDLTPVLATVCRWKRAIPQYKLRHREHIIQADQLLQERMPGCYLTGNYCYGVSLNDCVKQANAVAEDVLEFLD